MQFEIEAIGSLGEREQRVPRPDSTLRIERGEADAPRESQLEQLRSRAENHQPHDQAI